MPLSIAQLLSQWRKAKKWSQSALARRSSVHQATISRWESGDAQPRVNELELVLKALDVTTEERRQALGALSSTPAIRLLSDEQARPPMSGDLLRAMRVRRGWTQAETARKIEVTQGALAKWESTEDWPSCERLHALCFALNAHLEELEALLNGDLRITIPDGSGSNAVQKFACEGVGIGSLIEAGDFSLLDLRFLALSASAWPFAQQDRQVEIHIARGASCYAVGLMWQNRYREAKRYIRPILELASQVTSRDQGWLTTLQNAIYVSATISAYERKPSRPVRGVAQYSKWVSYATDPVWRATLYRGMADFAGQAGETETALRYCNLAERYAQVTEEPYHIRLSRHVRGGILLRAGQAQAALRCLPTEEETNPINQILGHLRWTETLLSLGDRTEAHTRLNHVYTIIQKHHLYQFQEQANDFAARL